MKSRRLENFHKEIKDGIYMKRKLTPVPARYVAAPQLVAFFVIRNVLLNFMQLFGEHHELIIAPARQSHFHSRRRSARFVRYHRTLNVAMTVK